MKTSRQGFPKGWRVWVAFAWLGCISFVIHLGEFIFSSVEQAEEFYKKNGEIL